MADKWNALNTFWNGFSLPAYEASTVPDDAVMPYITYEASIGSLDERQAHTASIWYRSTSWSAVSQKASEIEQAIGGGAGVRYDDGRLWVTKGYTFAQRMSDPDDSAVRRIVLQVNIEFQ